MIFCILKQLLSGRFGGSNFFKSSELSFSLGDIYHDYSQQNVLNNIITNKRHEILFPRVCSKTDSKYVKRN